MTTPPNIGIRIGMVFGAAGFILLMLVPLAFPYEFLGVYTYDLVIPKMFFLRLAAVSLFISLVFRLAFEPGIIGKFVANTWPVLAWLGWQALSFVWTEYTWATADAVIDTACIAACTLGAVMFFTGGRARGFGEVAFGIAAAVAALIFIFMPGKEGHAPFINENPGGMFLALAAVAAAGKFLSMLAEVLAKRPASRALLVFCGAVAVLSVAGVVKSDSRGAAIALAIGAFVMAVLAWKQRLIILSTALVLALAFLVAILAVPGLKENMLGRKYESTLWTRVFFWRGALDMIKEKPVLGRGAGSFAPANVLNQPVESYMHVGIKGPTPYAHDFYLEAAVETGVIGLAILGGVVLFLLLKARAAMGPDVARRWYLGGLVGAAFVALAHGGVDVVMSVTSTQVFFWLCVGGVLARGVRSEGEASRARAAQWLAALIPSACAIAVWGAVFSGELPREMALSRGKELYESAQLRLGAPDIEMLKNAERYLTYAADAPYQTRISLFARALRAKVLNETALSLEEKAQGGNQAEIGRLFDMSISDLRHVQALAPDMYDNDLNLGYALIDGGAFTANEGAIEEGCRFLIEHLRRNPFNIPERNEPRFANVEIMRALNQYLSDSALRREVQDIINRAQLLVDEGGKAVPEEVRASVEILEKHMPAYTDEPGAAEPSR